MRGELICRNLLTWINNGEMTGMDLTILILCDMFEISAMVLHERSPVGSQMT